MHIVLHDGVAADERMLVAQPLEHPLRSVTLLGHVDGRDRPPKRAFQSTALS
jgi:hypothetical protein